MVLKYVEKKCSDFIFIMILAKADDMAVKMKISRCDSQKFMTLQYSFTIKEDMILHSTSLSSSLHYRG